MNSNSRANWSGTLGATPVTADPAAWGAYLASLRDSVQTSWSKAREAYFTLKKVREDLGLPFKASPTGESPAYGMSSEAAWSDSLEQNAVDIQAMVKVCVDAANDAIAGKRKLVWNDKIGEFVIEGLSGDTYQIKRNSEGVPLLYAADGKQAHASGTIGLPQVIVGLAIGATVVQGLTIYFGVKKLCETLENVSSDKTIRTVMETQAEMIKGGASPEQAKAATEAVFQGAAAVTKAKGEAAANKPPDDWASTLKTLGYLAFGAAVIYAIIRLVPPIERAPRMVTAPMLGNPRGPHMAKPDKYGRHPKYKHLVMFEAEPYKNMYLVTAIGHEGSALISSDEAASMFGKYLDDGFAYLTDEYLQLLEKRAPSMLGNPRDRRAEVVQALEQEAAKEGLLSHATPTRGSWTNVHLDEIVQGTGTRVYVGTITVYRSGKISAEAASDARVKRVAGKIKARYGSVRSAA